VAKKAISRGTGEPNLWRHWKKYKDVAHLVAAATFICKDVRIRSRGEPFGPFGLSPDQFQPFQMTMLMPDLVLAVALEFERFGLECLPYARSKPTFDPDTLWRIPPDINVAPIPPPRRPIKKGDLAILRDRRAGNRGKANRRETTLIS
jgi:hypothetical protein